MATSSFFKTFTLKDANSVSVFIELEQESSEIKTRDRDNKTESQKAIKAFSKILSKKQINN